MSLGFAIRKQRKSLHLTLQGLANLINADGGNLSRIERGEQGLTEPMLRKICAALNCTPAFLYAQSDSFDANHTSEKNVDYTFYKKEFPQNLLSQNLTSPQAFVSWFRSVAPYIHAFRGKKGFGG